jgi:AcrR family transcriptional regulator
VDGVRRREAILDAALECFAKRGVMATGIEDIRKRARASPSSVYHQFKGVEDVTLALLARTFERLFAHLAERVGAARSAKRAVMALADAHIEWVLANQAEARVMYQAMSLEMSSRAAAWLSARKTELMAPLAQRFGAFMDKGLLPRWPALQLDVVALGASHEACRRLLAGAPLDPAWMRATLPALAWAAVRAAMK